MLIPSESKIPPKVLFTFEKSENHETKKEKGPTFATISRLYSVDFFKPDEKTNALQFFAVREQILEIEKLLTTTPCNQDSVRIRIQQLLSLDNYNKKMAELGMILFYLDNERRIPAADSLMTYRATEIVLEVEYYLKKHAESCLNPLIPSGKTHYLQRAFAQLIFTSSQAFNRGGLIAIQEFLNFPELKISKYLQPEHRDHILAVVNQLLTKSSCDSLFKRDVRVHPDLEDTIRIDLKLGPGEAITSVHILYDCMMALFADIRQLDTWNCYAISSLIYMTENHTFKTLRKMMQWLEEGHYAFSPFLTIPIRPLLDQRLIFSQDLEVKLETDQVLSLVTVGHIAETLSLEQNKGKKKEEESISHSLFGTTVTLPLGETLSTILHTTSASEHLPYAEKLYYAYKYNSLIHMQLAILEFAYMNSSEDPHPSSSLYSTVKETLIDVCITSLINSFQRNETGPSIEFSILLRKKLGEKLWLENCNHNHVQINQGSLIAGSERISSFRGDLSSLAQLFQTSLRVICLESRKYVPLKKISDLQSVIRQTIEETSLEFDRPDNKHQLAVKNLLRAVHSDQYRREISDYASSEIGIRGISGSDLNQADILIFDQIGGVGHITIGLVYGISVSREIFTGCHSPYQFLEKLLKRLQSLDTELLKAAPKVMMFNPDYHVWTLSPHCWNLLIENQNSFKSFIQKTVFNPAKIRLASKIPQDTVDRVIERFGKDNKQRKEMRDFFALKRSLTYAGFRDLLFSNVHVRRVNKIKKIIHEEFCKIVLSKQDLYEILQNLGFKPSQAQVEKIFNQLNPSPSLPYQLARELRSALIDENMGIKDPYVIELEVCRIKKLPFAIDVGDLNWLDAYREDPYHLHLIIAFSWAKGIPCYYIRDHNRETMENSAEYETVEINHPQIMIKSNTW